MPSHSNCPWARHFQADPSHRPRAPPAPRCCACSSSSEVRRTSVCLSLLRRAADVSPRFTFRQFPLFLFLFSMSWPSHGLELCAQPRARHQPRTECSVRYCHHAAGSGTKHPPFLFWKALIDQCHIKNQEAFLQSHLMTSKCLQKSCFWTSCWQDEALTGSQTDVLNVVLHFKGAVCSFLCVCVWGGGTF